MPTHLAPRELEYVQYVQQDLSDKQIARLMGVEPGTVQGTARRVRYKLHAASRIQVLINAAREGLISLCVMACAFTATPLQNWSLPEQGIYTPAFHAGERTNTRGLITLSSDYLDTLTAYDLEAYA